MSQPPSAAGEQGGTQNSTLALKFSHKPENGSAPGSPCPSASGEHPWSQCTRSRAEPAGPHAHSTALPPAAQPWLLSAFACPCASGLALSNEGPKQLPVTILKPDQSMACLCRHHCQAQESHSMRPKKLPAPVLQPDTPDHGLTCLRSHHCQAQASH